MFLQIVNFGSNKVNLKISVDGLEPNSVGLFGSTQTTLTSTNLMDENSFKDPKKVRGYAIFPLYMDAFLT